MSIINGTVINFSTNQSAESFSPKRFFSLKAAAERSLIKKYQEKAARQPK
jgi:hypothetical protein